jgi:DNA-binding MarR family transcriptional regulator
MHAPADLPSPSSERLRLILEAKFGLLSIADRLRQNWAAHAAAVDLSPAQVTALLTLVPGEALPMRSLAARLDYDASNLSVLIDRLEGRGAVERRPDPDDRRVKALVLTPEGERLRAAFWRALTEDPGALEPLGNADLSALARILDALGAALLWLRVGPGTQAVECGLQDRLEVAAVAADGGDGDDQVDDLLEGEVVADLARALRGEQQRPGGGDHPGAVAAEYRVAAVRVLKQLGGDVVLAGDEGVELAQPGREGRAGGRAAHVDGRVADGVDLVGVEGLEQLPAPGEVAVQGRHADSRAARDLGHRYLGRRIGEGGAGGGEDLVAVALGVGSSRR